MSKENTSIGRHMQEQVQEAADRVPGSSSLARSMKEQRDEASPEAIQERAGREAANKKRTAELRKELGIDSNPTTPESTADQITKGFEVLADSVKGAAKAKVEEYDNRIRAALIGNPLKKGDTVENVKQSFKEFTKKDWTEDFKP